MGKGLLSGIAAGAVVSFVVLALVSELTQLPAKPGLVAVEAVEAVAPIAPAAVKSAVGEIAVAVSAEPALPAKPAMGQDLVAGLADRALAYRSRPTEPVAPVQPSVVAQQDGSAIVVPAIRSGLSVAVRLAEITGPAVVEETALPASRNGGRVAAVPEPEMLTEAKLILDLPGAQSAGLQQPQTGAQPVIVIRHASLDRGLRHDTLADPLIPLQTSFGLGVTGAADGFPLRPSEPEPAPVLQKVAVAAMIVPAPAGAGFRAARGAENRVEYALPAELTPPAEGETGIGVQPTPPQPVKPRVLQLGEPKLGLRRAGQLTPGTAAMNGAPKPGLQMSGTAALPGPDSNGPESPALLRNAAAFENPLGKPLFSILLQDDGTADPKVLASLGFPVTVVLDPAQPFAGKAEASYRAAGLEVLILATGVPQGATASDLEVTFQSDFDSLPGAVGVIDLALAGFQDDRELSQQVVEILAGGGYGLVTYDRGFDPAAQVAEREGLGQARVSRTLDSAGESRETIRRYLDRAAFKAAQSGSAVVIGHARAETIRALVEWAADGRSANMALAPISAVMRGQ